MKNKILITILSLALLVSCDPVFAQLSYAGYATIPASAGANPSGNQYVSAISTTTTYLYFKPTQGYKSGSFQFVTTRVSAAIGGTINLEVSNDGINYNVPLASGTTTTITVANAATTFGLVDLLPVNGVIYNYYRAKIIGASSDTMTVRGYFCGRQ